MLRVSSLILVVLLALPLSSGLVCGDEPSALPATVAAVVEVVVDPPTVVLEGPQAAFTLLVNGRLADGRIVDLTLAARFDSPAGGVLTVSRTGLVRGVADGMGTVEIAVAGTNVSVPVRISGATTPRPFNFENDIIPLLSKFGCNTSGCHGKAEGQNGFKLSVFGFDPAADFAALTQEGRGRRILATVPEQSLLVTKASGRTPHGGGVRIDPRSAEYRLLADWIIAGLPFGSSADPHVVSIEVTPFERELTLRGQQQLRVVATFSDGHRSDVTAHARYQTNNEGLGTVNESGLVTVGENPGEVAIMAAYMGQMGVFRAMIPRAQRIEQYPAIPEHNSIDGLVFRKLQKLNIVPSDIAADADFLRRAFLDVIGTLPTSDEARTFLSDSRPDRRSQLVDQLLQRPEFADFWALKWADILRVDRQALGHKRAYAYYRWIRESLAANKPYDQFCREIVGGEGAIADVPGGSFYKVVTGPGAMASTLSQVFLGVRIECAQCHHHPFDRWSQTDYYGMQAFFTGVAFKPGPVGEVLLDGAAGPTVHPRTGEPVFAHALGAAMPSVDPPAGRRKLLADWMTSPDNPWFARNFANRVWGHFLGRGLIEPVDDMRLTNPASNPELLDALARHVVETKFDFRQLIRTITASRVYQLSTTPNATNARDDQNYSRALLKRLDAEVLFDAICQTTGVPEKFQGLPAGYRAIQLWDSQTPHYFLKLFGRPTRVTACECERATEPSVAQVLHVLNSPEIQEKLAHAGGRIVRLTSSITDSPVLVDELYLTFFSRFPSADERDIAVRYLARHAADRQSAVEDIAWSMLNSSEFVFNH